MQAGEKIVIASNSMDSQQTEELTISTVNNGKQLNLKDALRFDHSSHSLATLPTQTLSAEIAPLKRSISITSAMDSLASGQGAFVLLRGDISVSLQNVLCLGCGQVRFRNFLPA